MMVGDAVGCVLARILRLRPLISVIPDKLLQRRKLSREVARLKG